MTEPTNGGSREPQKGCFYPRPGEGWAGGQHTLVRATDPGCFFMRVTNIIQFNSTKEHVKSQPASPGHGDMQVWAVSSRPQDSRVCFSLSCRSAACPVHTERRRDGVRP